MSQGMACRIILDKNVYTSTWDSLLHDSDAKAPSWQKAQNFHLSCRSWGANVELNRDRQKCRWQVASPEHSCYSQFLELYNDERDVILAVGSGQAFCATHVWPTYKDLSDSKPRKNGILASTWVHRHNLWWGSKTCTGYHLSSQKTCGVSGRRASWLTIEGVARVSDFSVVIFSLTFLRETQLKMLALVAAHSGAVVGLFTRYFVVLEQQALNLVVDAVTSGS